MELYKINERMRAWARKIAEQDGEVLPEDMDEIEQIEADFTEKAEGYAVIINEQQEPINKLSAEIERLTKRREQYKKTQEWLKKCLASAMFQNGKEKVKTEKYLISFRKSKSVQFEDENLVPDEFCKIERTPMKMEIKKAIEAGQAVSGCYIEENRSLQIR